MGAERKLVKRFDADSDGMLNAQERAKARESIKSENRSGRGGRGGPGRFGPPGMGGQDEAVKPGPHVAPGDAKSYPGQGLYEPSILRTLFIDFESADWEAELADFHNTDVEVPATLTVDGVKYPNVGVHFRGASSYMMVGAGHKRSLNLSMDFADSKQRLLGVRTLNLLNSHEDPSFLCTVLYSAIANRHIPAPRANTVAVVINGESWGVYVNVEQFNKDFCEQRFGSGKGARWKVKGSPMGDAGLNDVGDEVEAYKQRYQIRSEDDPKAWKALIKLCKTLSNTPLDELESALRPMLDIDSALWFLALDNALVNNDGYWCRASDYSLFLDSKGVFHIVPHDMNEAFSLAGGGGGRGPRGGPPREGEGRPGPEVERDRELRRDQQADGPRAQPVEPPGGERGDPDRPAPAPAEPRQGRPRFGPPGMNHGTVELDPLVGMNDARKPLRSRLLAVPALRARYLSYVRQIAEKDLAWDSIGPIVAQYRAVLEEPVAADTRKLTSTADFVRSTADSLPEPGAAKRGGGLSVREFARRRSAYLIEKTRPEEENAAGSAEPNAEPRP